MQNWYRRSRQLKNDGNTNSNCARVRESDASRKVVDDLGAACGHFHDGLTL